jgi:hypothetical protein
VESSKLKELIDRALQDKILTRAEQQEILQAVTADSQVSRAAGIGCGAAQQRRDSRRGLSPFSYSKRLKQYPPGIA